MLNKLMCGASRKCITPSERLLPALYGLRRQSFGGVLDDLFLRVLTLKAGEKTLLLVCFDLDKAPYPRKWITHLSQRFQIPEEQILYTAIHTHSAPVTDVRPYEGPNRRWMKSAEQQRATEEYESFLLEQLTAAAEEALSSLQIARFGYACGDSYINVSRNCTYRDQDGCPVCNVGINGTGDVDHTLFAARFETEDGTPIAFLMNYAVHNCIMHQNTMFDGKLAISSDLGGNVSQLLEKHHPGAVAMWTSGAAGDVNPMLMNAVSYPDTEDGTYVEEQLTGDQTLFLRTMTARHYADVRAVVEKIRCGEDAAQLAGGIQWVKTPGRPFPEEVDFPEEYRPKETPDYEIRLQALRVGAVAICGISGELYTSLGRAIQSVSPFGTTLIVNHNACQMANSQYIFDDEGIARNALGYNHSFIRPGYVKLALEQAAKALLSRLEEN